MSTVTRILLVEDSPRDAEMALNALEANQLANEVVHVRDGAEALDYLYRRGEFAERPEGPPALVLLDLKLPKVDGLEVRRQLKGDPKPLKCQDFTNAVQQVGAFWTVTNEVPPGSHPRTGNVPIARVADE